MAVFEVAHDLTMGNEGGFANNPADVGGMTYKGIAIKYHTTWRGWQYVKNTLAAAVNQPPYGSAEYRNWARYINKQLEDIPSLQKLVLEFYRANFWQANCLDLVGSQTVANQMYDWAVNTGSRGNKWIQRALGIEDDGSIGPKTIAAINAADASKLLLEAREHAKAHRLKVVADKPSQKQFLVGWLTRDGFSKEEIKEIIA